MNAILFSNVPVHTVRMVGFIFAPTEPEGSIMPRRHNKHEVLPDRRDS